LDFVLDPPSVFVTAARASFRRWRTERLGNILPQLVPQHADLHVPNGARTIVYNMLSVVAPLAKGRPISKKATTPWNPAWAPYLTSAMNNGQWPQVRKTKVAAWKITSTKCQLCFKEEGTNDH